MKTLHTTFIHGLLWALAGISASAGAETLTVANFGGANGQAQQAAFYAPFAQANQGTAVQGVEYSGDLAPLIAMRQKGQPAWDVMEVESADLKTGCEAGYFERIDRTALPHASLLLPGAVQDCGLGAFVWSTVLAFDSQQFKQAPQSWADFWDIQRFPGKRGLRKGLRYNLEFALMADGVHRRDVYAQLATPAGMARALKKLDQLAPHVVWWEAGAQAPQYLLDGTVSMTTAFNGRIAAAQQAGQQRLRTVWSDAIYDMDYWVIVKNTPRRALAQAFIGFATSEEAQLAFSRAIAYGPTHMGAIMKHDGRVPGAAAAAPSSSHLIDLSMVPSDMPSAPGNLRRALAFDAGFWRTHGSAIDRLAAGKRP